MIRRAGTRAFRRRIGLELTPHHNGPSDCRDARALGAEQQRVDRDAHASRRRSGPDPN
jgi:hypothetical protein